MAFHYHLKRLPAIYNATDKSASISSQSAAAPGVIFPIESAAINLPGTALSSAPIACQSMPHARSNDTALRCVRQLPASVPSGRSTRSPNLRAHGDPSIYSPSGMPEAAVASVTPGNSTTSGVECRLFHVNTVQNDLSVLGVSQSRICRTAISV